jgi:hypothetical protein
LSTFKFYDVAEAALLWHLLPNRKPIDQRQQIARRFQPNSRGKAKHRTTSVDLVLGVPDHIFEMGAELV